jgi:hypothetical protein
MEPWIYDDAYKQTFDSLIDKSTDCWRWKIYSPHSQSQGRYYHRGCYRRNRTVAYELYNNISLGNKTMLYSTCKKRGCINPEHVRITHALKNKL